MVKQRCLDGENVVINSFCSGRSMKSWERLGLGSDIKNMEMTSFITKNYKHWLLMQNKVLRVGGITLLAL